MRVASKSPKKNARFFMSGPPKLPPNWFWLFVGFGWFARFAKKLFESNLSSRKKSYAVPWNWFVPAFVLTTMAAPGDQPYSAA